MDKYNESKIDAGIKTIKNLCGKLQQNNNEELREHLWKLQREAALLMELIEEEIYIEDDYRQAM